MLTVLTVCTSCEKELDFDYHSEPPKLVIEGHLDQYGAKVSITSTTPMTEPMDTTRLTDASVTVLDITTGQSRTLAADSNGLFTDTTPGIIGHDYRLCVKRHSKVYYSECRMTAPVEFVDMSFRWIKMPYDYVAVLRISLTDTPDEKNHYWVRLLRNGEPYQWMFLSDTDLDGQTVSGVTMTSRMDTDEEDDKNVLVDGDRVTAIVTPVTEKMVDYLSALSNDSNGPAMFSGDYCLGYFMAAPVAEMSVIFHSDQIKTEE